MFLGLVKLVKKSALEDANQNLIKDAEFANKALQNTLENLSRKEGEIALIRQQFRILKKENQVLKEQLNSCKCQKSQNEKLSNFVEELSNKNTKLAKS